MGEQTIGSIMLFAGDFAPREWAFCDGQILSIADNQALYAIIGNIYGGDGRVTFALPDLRGRTPIHSGNGNRAPGLTPRPLGQRGGEETHNLTLQEMPSHLHAAAASNNNATGAASISAEAILHASNSGTTNDPNGNFVAKVPNMGPQQIKSYGSAADIEMNAEAITIQGQVDLSTIPPPTVTLLNNGGNQSHYNMQPFLAINYIIALTGIFPSRS